MPSIDLHQRHLFSLAKMPKFQRLRPRVAVRVTAFVRRECDFTPASASRSKITCSFCMSRRAIARSEIRSISIAMRQNAVNGGRLPERYLDEAYVRFWLHARLAQPTRPQSVQCGDKPQVIVIVERFRCTGKVYTEDWILITARRSQPSGGAGRE